MSVKSESVVIDEILLIAKAVKKHLNESDCKHDIRTIVNEALNNRVRAYQTRTRVTNHQENQS